MKIKRSKRFLIIFMASLVSFTIAYPLTYNALVTKNSLINHSYKDFLLRYTTSPRLIIDSGSNSVYGLNSHLLEKELGILTINLADNLSCPLREKLMRLEKYTHPGDIVLLPLEWTYYLWNNDTNRYFSDSLFNELNFYYQAMPLSIKLDLIAKSPFSSILSAIIKKLNAVKLVSNEYSQLLDYEDKFNHYERGDYKGTLVFGQNKESRYSCNEFIFGHKGQPPNYAKDLLKKGFVLSDVFKKNMALIKQLQRKGVHIIFTWPAVVGNDCYKKNQAALFQLFIMKTKQYLTQNDIVVIGEPNDSLFAAHYLFDSYYHVIPAARDKRTKKIIAELKKSTAITWFKKTPAQKGLLIISSALLEPEFMHFLKNSLAAINHRQIIKIKAEANGINFFVTKGWYPIEPWGVWSKENESVLYVKLTPELLQQNLQLTIENDLYKTPDKTTVLINDKKLGDYLLEGRKSIMIPSYYLTDKTGLVKIQFNHIKVKSPLEYGDNSDNRQIKFGLKSLQFTRLDN